MACRSFDTKYAIKIHDEIIKSSGGLYGVLSEGLIESVLEHLKNDLYYPDIQHKTTHLFFSINKNHCFKDGNKRASIALSAYFLELNGFGFCANKLISEMENFAVEVANNRIDKELLLEIIQSIIFEEEYNEELKLKIIRALQ